MNTNLNALEDLCLGICVIVIALLIIKIIEKIVNSIIGRKPRTITAKIWQIETICGLFLFVSIILIELFIVFNHFMNPEHSDNVINHVICFLSLLSYLIVSIFLVIFAEYMQKRHKL